MPPPPPLPDLGLGADRAEMLRARLDRWWPDLHAGLVELYGADRALRTGTELVTLAARAFARRPDRLHRRDLERMLRPDWFQDPAMVGYAAYTERFADDLRGVSNHLSYLEELGVSYLHLMPLLEPREGDNDGGYAVVDYRSVRPDLGHDGRPRRARRRRCATAGISLVPRPRAQPRGP